MSETKPKTGIRRRLKLWGGIALLACLFAFAMSYWESMRGVDELVKFARSHQGIAHIEYRHPEWVRGFVSDETFLPGFDNLYSYTVFVPISDDQLVYLSDNAELLDLTLDVSNCSPASLSTLEKQKDLRTLSLHGRQHQFALDWIKSLTKLEKLTLLEVPLTPNQTQDLLQQRYSELILDGMIARFERYSRRSNSNEYYPPASNLIFEKDELTKQDAEYIVSLSSLPGLRLAYSNSDLEFWQTLGRQSEIESLSLRPLPASTEFRVGATELAEIRKLPQLVELTLDVSNSSPETIMELEKLPNLVEVELYGQQQEIPLEWLKSLPNLTQITLHEIPVAPERWADLLSISQLKAVDFRDERISISRNTSPSEPDLSMILHREHLTQVEAEAILANPGLNVLSLNYSSSTPHFWQTLSRHQNIQSLSLDPLSLDPLSTTREFRFGATELAQIQKLPELVELTVNISNIAPETIMEFENLPQLTTIELRGQEQEIPLEWLKSMPHLTRVNLRQISVTPDRWSDLLSFSQLNKVSISGREITISKDSEASEPDFALSLDREHLAQAEAEAILAIPDLKTLALDYISTAPEFWQTLSRHQELESLVLYPPKKKSGLLITSTELDQIAKIPSLSKLTLHFHWNNAELDLQAGERFRKMRPDVVLMLSSPDSRGKYVSRVFGQEPETITDDE